MVSAAKAFEKEPPRRPLTDLEAICEDFQWRYVDRKKTDQVIEYCRRAPSFHVAVARAVEARDADGKHHNHQSKVDIGARRLFGKRIVTRRNAVRRLVAKEDADKVFDLLHDLFDEIKPYGIGPVTVYDVAVRVGAFLGIEPTSVYMHAGVRQGMKTMVAAMPDWWEHSGEPWRADRVSVKVFPPPLNSMRADDVEDILCTYREVFIEWLND